mmetsp:Transcript_34308/g.82960  ORF Transcript_34308/g.82960 Transcript_34308/m.82960 type:complete len:246 (+) Transcript_34308:609-1346(+)
MLLPVLPPGARRRRVEEVPCCASRTRNPPRQQRKISMTITTRPSGIKIFTCVTRIPCSLSIRSEWHRRRMSRRRNGCWNGPVWTCGRSSTEAIREERRRSDPAVAVMARNHLVATMTGVIERGRRRGGSIVRLGSRTRRNIAVVPNEGIVIDPPPIPRTPRIRLLCRVHHKDVVMTVIDTIGSILAIMLIPIGGVEIGAMIITMGAGTIHLDIAVVAEAEAAETMKDMAKNMVAIVIALVEIMMK